MSIPNHFELASVAMGPFDEDREFYIYKGYVLNERYIFILDEGTLWLRHVHKVAHIDHFYIDGDTGGMILAEQIKENVKDLLLDSIVDRLRGMDALTFLTDVLLWLPDRIDMNLKLDCFQ